MVLLVFLCSNYTLIFVGILWWKFGTALTYPQAQYVIPLRAVAQLPTSEFLDVTVGQKQRVRRHDDMLTIFRRLNTTLNAPSTIPISEMKNKHFVGDVDIGTPPQRMRLIFDTGSTNLEVVSVRCRDHSCEQVQRFDPQRSSTFKPLNLPSINVKFGTGAIHARFGSDVVAVGPFKVDQQAFGLIDHEHKDPSSSRNVFDNMHFEGILGLGLPSLASPGTEPFFDNVIRNSNGKINQFAIYVGNPKDAAKVARTGEQDEDDVHSAAFFIGGVDSRFYTGDIVKVPVTLDHYWAVGLDSLMIGDTEFCCRQNPKSTSNNVIIDTGTTYNTFPSTEYRALLNLVPPRPCDFRSPASLKDFPTLTYKLTGGVVLSLTPQMYLIRDASGICQPGVMEINVPSRFGHDYVIGAYSLRHFFTVFERGKPSTVRM